MTEQYFPKRNGGIRIPLAVLTIIVTFLLSAGTGLIWIGELRTEIRTLKEHDEAHADIAAHGTVAERLTEHDTRLDGQERSLDTVKKSNKRNSDDLSKLRTDIEVMRHELNTLRSYRGQSQ